MAESNVNGKNMYYSWSRLFTV